MLAVFVLWERRTEEPMMPLSMFRSRNFSGANILTLLLYAGLGGSLYFLPFLLIQVHDYSATAAGSAFLPFIIVVLSMTGRNLWTLVLAMTAASGSASYPPSMPQTDIPYRVR